MLNPVAVGVILIYILVVLFPCAIFEICAYAAGHVLAAYKSCLIKFGVHGLGSRCKICAGLTGQADSHAEGIDLGSQQLIALPGAGVVNTSIAGTDGNAGDLHTQAMERPCSR